MLNREGIFRSYPKQSNKMTCILSWCCQCRELNAAAPCHARSWPISAPAILLVLPHICLSRQVEPEPLISTDDMLKLGGAN